VNKLNNKFLEKIIKDENIKKGGLLTKGVLKKNRKNFPLITIIMPNYKSPSLTKSINSVLRQTYKNIELIIVDGDSGFSTLKKLNELNNKIDLWISEKDKGMWDAWNKGFKLASGEFIGVVDSSNILYKNAIKILARYVNRYKKIDFICGTVIKDKRKIGGYNPKIIYRNLNIIPSSVVGFYIRKSSLKRTGYLNLNYKIQADQELLYRMIVKHKFIGVHTKGNEVFGNLGNSGFSTKHNFLKILINEIKIRFNNKQNLFMIILIFFGRIIKKIFKNLL